MVHIAWLGKKSPFCGNVSYGNLVTEQLKVRGHKVSFIHFDNPSNAKESKTLFLANDPEKSMPLLAKTLLNPIIAGLFISGAVAAMMSTADSQLLVSTSAITEDFFNLCNLIISLEQFLFIIKSSANNIKK